LIRRWRAVALLAVTAIAASCTVGTPSFNGSPYDLYSAMPSQGDVQKLMNDANWWAGAPSFEVEPLDSATTPPTERFAVSRSYLHLGTSEELFARYTVYNSTSSATSEMSDVQTGFGTSPTSPKVGDQVLYYGAAGSGGAPFVTRTFVRVGQIVLEIVWTRKDALPTVNQLARNATVFAAGLKNISKVHVTAQPVSAEYLPPPGFDITLLGSAQLPVESFVVMVQSAAPTAVLSLLQGIATFPYGDYALNNDTHMEVQTAVLTFATPTDASDFAATFGPGSADTDGIFSGYIPSGGTPAAGSYRYVFAANTYGVLLICKPSLDGEAASRECEDPMHNTALAWKLALGG
jgi:hypothetical protein